MSEGSLGVATLDLEANTDKLEDGLEKGKKKVESKVEGITNAFNAILASAVLSAIVKAYNQVVAAAEEALVTEAKVAGVLRATGNAAGFTVNQLSAMADEFSRLTGVDDEVILNAEAVLLTFRKIGKDVFPEATKAALDMSAVMGQDLQSSMVQIGKALNDPIAGISALSRVGVTFTEDQKDMIKSFVEMNDIAGAQGVILEELQSEFGGTAEEMEQASTGSARLKVAFGNLQEEIGRNLVPQQRMWNEILIDTLDILADATAEHNDYIDVQRRAIEIYNETNDTLILSRAQYNMNRDAIDEIAASIQHWTNYGLAWEERLAAETGGVTDLGIALETLDFKSLLDLTISLSGETAKFNEQQEGVRAKQAEIKTEIDNLIASGWSPLSEKVSGLQTKYDDLGLAYDNNAIKHKAAMDKILFDLFMQKISVDGVTDAEYEMALQIGMNTGVIDAASAEQALAFDQVTNAVLDGKIAVEDTQRVLDLMARGYTISVAIAVSGMNQLHEVNQLGNVPGHTYFGGGRAGGGDVFSGEYYVVGEDGPELFAPGMDGSIIPNMFTGNPTMSAPAIAADGGMSLSGAGGGSVVNFTYQPFVGVNDEYEAEAKLRGIFERISRRGVKQ